MIRRRGALHQFFRYSSRPLEGREHVTLRAAIPMRFTRAARRSTRVLRKKRAKHLAFQVDLYCNVLSEVIH